MQVSKSPTIHLEETTLDSLEKYRQHLLATKGKALNYDKVIATLLIGAVPRKPKTRSKKNV